MYELAEVKNFNFVEQDQISPETKEALLDQGWTEADEDLIGQESTSRRRSGSRPLDVSAALLLRAQLA